MAEDGSQGLLDIPVMEGMTCSNVSILPLYVGLSVYGGFRCHIKA